MLKNSVLLGDEKFESEPKDGCDLLVQVADDSFSYAIINRQSNELKRLFSLQGKTKLYQEISQVFATDHFLALGFASVKVSVQTPSLLFVPKNLYNSHQKEKYTNFLVETENVLEYHHEDLEVVSLFNINKLLFNHFPSNTKYLPALAALSVCTPMNSAYCFLVEFGSESVSFLYLKNRELQFYNTFLVGDAEEFNYFLLLVKQQLNLDSNILTLIQGLVEEKDNYFECLKKYFSNIKINVVEELAYNHMIDQIPAHYFNSLLALLLCE